MPTTPSSSFPAPMRLSAPPMSPQQRWQRATSRSASSRSRCPRSAPSSSAPARRARRRSSIRRPRSNSTPQLLDLVDILILNETELGLLTKTELHDSDDHARFIEAARSLPIGRDRIVCVTLGKRGVVALVDGEPLIVPGRAVKAVDTTGAGDCFVGAVAAQLAGGKLDSTTRWITPTPRLRSACSGWAPRRRCRRRRKWMSPCLRVVPANAGTHNPGVG